MPHPATGETFLMPGTPEADHRPAMLGGGGGLIGTASDYLRFTHMLLNRGELDGVRLLGSRTVDYMTRNHLPGNADLEAFGRPLFAETTFDGVGFGLGFSVTMDTTANRVLASKGGDYAWGGAASTVFWIDPAEELVGAVPHPAPAVEHVPDPRGPQDARLSGARRLNVPLSGGRSTGPAAAAVRSAR